MHNMVSDITQMFQDIQTDILARNAGPGDPMFDSWYVANLEAEQGNPPSLHYVHNVLASALGRPLATKH